MIMEVSSNLKLSGGDNWAVWQFEMEVILKGRRLFGIVSGAEFEPVEGENEEVWVQNAATTQEFIITRMESGPLTHLLSRTTSSEMWSNLKSVYAKESAVSVYLLQQKFFLIEFNEYSVPTFMSKLE
ncbi:hypothetical protein PR048_020317 [Dryococelus australis]|uniref:Retrotransposon Copia-like N-terminal domain-containing protein n=1 Tax=Dryococelus australis TaxID=614101 RepID=A0ABQ9H5Y5_9NEOP|nr:hypothetical protein PR048_020317 [Dryococelus australis]